MVEKINVLEYVNGIDFNCGCFVFKVVNYGNGSGLLKDLNYLVKFLKIIRENISKKIISVKVCLGFEKKIFKEIVYVLNDVLVDYVVVYGRI